MRGRVQRSGAAGTPQKSVKTIEMRMPRSRNAVPLTPETIGGYLEHLQAKGRAQGTIDSYSRKIKRLYRELPEDGKMIRQGTLRVWREELSQAGCTPAAINQFIVAANGYLEYMGAREFQVVDKLDAVPDPQPELTRGEYLRLLSTARSLGREQVYLLVKLFGNMDLPVQELGHVTVEAVRAGMLSVSYSCSKEIIRFPGCLCRELLDYAQSRGIRTGPVFLTRNGKPIDRTNVTVSIRRLCRAAQLPEEKGSPRCLRKLYQATREGIERNVTLLVERAQDRLMEEEQLQIGWDG